MNAPSPIPRWRIALLLAGLSMFGPFSIDTLFPAFGAVAADYGVGAVAMQQTVSVYLIAYAATSLFHGPLSDAYGRKPVILCGVVLFLLASVGCALAPDLGTLLVFRALQGVSAGAGLIIGRAVIRDLYHGDDAQRLMSLVMMIFGVAPGIAPIVGGWILGWAAWQTIFWFLAVFAGVLLLAATLGLPETHPRARRTPLRLPVMWATSRKMAGDAAFVRVALAGALNFGALFLFIASAPAFVQGYLGLSEQDYGWFFMPLIAGMMGGALLNGRLAGRLPPARVASLGFGVCLAAMAVNVAGNAVAAPALPWAVLPVAAASFGVALAFPILTLVLLDMYPDQRGTASSMQAFVSLSSNAMVAGLLSPLLSPSPLRLAAGAAVLTLVAWLLWRRHLADGSGAGGKSSRREVEGVGPVDHA